MNDTGKISIQINSRLFHRLQSVAEPLIDDTDSVIEKLLSHWEASPPSIQGNGKNFWISPRGERFPIGTKRSITMSFKRWQTLSAIGR